MGCVLSGKMLQRTYSNGDDLQRGIHRQSNSYPFELLISKNVEQILANSEKHRSIPEDSGVNPVEIHLPEVINTWELMAGLDDDHEQVPNPASEYARADGDLEEAEILPESPTTTTGGALMRCQSCKRLSNLIVPDPLEFFEFPVPGKETLSEFSFSGISGSYEETCSSTETDQGSFESSETGGAPMRGKLRKHRRPSRLSDLVVPDPPEFFEFPAPGSLKDWLKFEGEVFYSTPKFGEEKKVRSWRRLSSGSCGGSGELDPELLAAFEEAWAELVVEEEAMNDIREEVNWN